MKKIKICLFILLSILAVHPVSAGNLYLDIHFVENMFFSKYGVEVYIDDEYIDTIPHGTDYTRLLEDIPDGWHEIWFQNEDDIDVTGSNEFSTFGDTTYQCTISAYEDEIRISNMNMLNNTDLASIPVPDLEGEILSDALKELHDAGFAKTESRADDGSIWDEDNWIVISQNLEAGSTADKNEPIILTCEKTKKHLEDRMIGLDIPQTSKKAEDLQFEVHFVNNTNDTRMDERLESMTNEEKEQWKAISVDPFSSGKRAAYVNMLYYGTREVPDVTDSSLDDALSILADHDFSNVKYTSLESKSVWMTSNWAVLRQSAEPGSNIAADSSIELFVKSYSTLSREQEEGISNDDEDDEVAVEDEGDEEETEAEKPASPKAPMKSRPEATVTSIPLITITSDMVREKCIGTRIGVVKKRFEKAGFKNLYFTKQFTKNIDDDKTVSDISIGELNSFSEGDTFDPDTSVQISYWIYQPAPTTTPTPACTATSTPVPTSTATPTPTATATPTPAPIATATPTPTEAVAPTIAPSPTAEPPKEYTDIGTIMSIQTNLNALGYDCGDIDGDAGTRTRAAISGFQADHDLEVNGLITDDFIKGLNDAIDAYNQAQAEEATTQNTSKFDYAYEYRLTIGDESYYLLIDVDEQIIIQFYSDDRARIVSHYTGDLNDRISWPVENILLYGKWENDHDPSSVLLGIYDDYGNPYDPSQTYVQIDVNEAVKLCKLYSTVAINMEDEEVDDSSLFAQP